MKVNICGYLLLSLLPTVVSADIGSIDRRKNVNWNMSPYNKFVRICNDAGCATGQFISAAHILTSKGTAACCGVSGKPECVVYTSEANNYTAKLVQAGGGTKKCDNTQDLKNNWAVLELNIPKTEIQERAKNTYINGKEKYLFKSGTLKQTGLWRGGFGILKVLSDQDIRDIKAAYAEWLKVVYPIKFWVRDNVAEESVNLELYNYDINKDKKHFTTFLTKFKELTGKDFIADYLSDGEQFKIIENCSLSQYSSQFAGLVHNCSTWAGDGGSAILDKDNRIVALATHTLHKIGGNGNENLAIPTNDIFSDVKKMLETPVSAERLPHERTIYYPVNGDAFVHSCGHAAWRNNNMGNLVWRSSDPRAIGSGGPQRKGTKNSRLGKFAAYATAEDGKAALKALLTGPNYINKTIKAAMYKYAPPQDGNNPEKYAKLIAEALNRPVDTLISSLTDAQLNIMINTIDTAEGKKKGRIIKCEEQPERCEESSPNNC